jgi:TolB-like protein/DNA-binding winged helix-turn-helix (wHTH) protein/Flp pilus assembly protein TadD
VPDPERRVRFGVFELDPRAGELLKNGVKVRLEGQPGRLLQLLVERPGQVVTREELKQKLWRADTFVDFDHGINESVKRLRHALEDSADEPRFIETLPRRGYRFIHPVDQAGVEDIRSQKSWRRRWPGVVVLVLLAGFLALTVASRDGRFFGGAEVIESVAVLPFENLTGDPGQEYLVDGISNELTTELAGIKALRVISRTSAIHYKGARKSTPQIAEELSVEAIVEGSVQRSGERVTVSVRVIHAPTDRHLWSKNFEGEQRDILALQGEVARAVAREIRVNLTPQERARLARARSVDPKAHEAYLLGRYFWSQRSTEATMRRAITYFEQAIALDPLYAEAYAGLADCHMLLQFYGPTDPNESWPKTKAAADKALELNASLAEAHNSLAIYLHRRQHDWAAAETEFKRALDLNPNYADGHRSYAIYLRTMNRLDEARAEIERANRLDPRSLSGTASVARESYFARNYDRAITEGRQQLAADPNHVQVHYWLGLAYAEKRDFPNATAELQKAIDLSGGNTIYVAGLAYTYAKSARKDRARELLGQLEQLSTRRYVPPYRLASVYAALGDNDRAFAYLEKAYEERGLHVGNINVDPMMDSLRADPRFGALLRRMQLPHAS